MLQAQEIACVACASFPFCPAVMHVKHLDRSTKSQVMSVWTCQQNVKVPLPFCATYPWLYAPKEVWLLGLTDHSAC